MRCATVLDRRVGQERCALKYPGLRTGTATTPSRVQVRTDFRRQSMPNQDSSLRRTARLPGLWATSVAVVWSVPND